MILVDILTDGIFAAVAAIGFGAISDPPLRAFPSIALLAAIGHALSDDLSGSRYRHYISICFFQYRHGKSGFGKTYLLPHDRALHPCIAAYDSGYVRLQNSILTHHVHAEYESTGIAGKVSDRLIHEHNCYL